MDTLPAAPPKPSVDDSSEQPRRVDSSQLLRGARTVEIEHAGQRYTLRLTRENKLILTK